MHVLVCLWIGLVACMMFSFICCPLNCVMIARCHEHSLKNIWVWQLHHSVIGHHMNVLHAFLEGIEILPTITKKSVLYRVLQNVLSRELQSVFCTLSYTSVSYFFSGKDQKENNKKKKGITA